MALKLYQRGVTPPFLTFQTTPVIRFMLDRHDGPDDADSDTGDDDSGTSNDQDDTGDDSDDGAVDDPPAAAKRTGGDKPAPKDDPDAGAKSALAKERGLRAKAEKDARDARKVAAAAQARVQEFEDAQKSELERATAAQQRAEEKARKAMEFAVLASVRSLALGAEFEDPEDAVDALKPGDFVGADGDIDTDAIREALDALLIRKPHWKKKTPVVAETKTETGGKESPKHRVATDPGQGKKSGAGSTPDYGDDRDRLAADAGALGIRLRSAGGKPSR
jgi:hypothetical protein